jgi:hypothetical protein
VTNQWVEDRSGSSYNTGVLEIRVHGFIGYTNRLFVTTCPDIGLGYEPGHSLKSTNPEQAKAEAIEVVRTYLSRLLVALPKKPL